MFEHAGLGHLLPIPLVRIETRADAKMIIRPRSHITVSAGRFEQMPARFRILSSLAAALVLAQVGIAAGQDLQKRLEAEGAAVLAKAARQDGDPQRGAIVFHQAYLGCAKCHDHDRAADQGSTSSGLGPDLTEKESNSSDNELVNSVLSPSSV